MAFATIGKSWGCSNIARSGASLGRGVLLLCALFFAGNAFLAAQTPSTADQPASQQAQPAAQQPGQDIPDAPSTAQPPPPPSKLPPVSGPDIAPADPNAKHEAAPAAQQPDSDQTSFSEDIHPRPKMAPIKTLPPGTSPRNQVSPKDDLYTISVPVNFVLVPVMVKDRRGRRVDGLLPSDFTILENGKKQNLTFFTSDPFELSVAIVLDMGLPDVVIQRVNETYTALVGAFSPYDEVALYTYSSTVSQVSDFTGSQRKLTAIFDQVKTERGANNGVPVLGGPMSAGPTVNGIPVGGSMQPVNTPPRESHVLNDAILQAAVDLAKRDRTRRKVIFVISDGREFGSSANFSEVVRVLQKNEIQIKAVALDTAELPVYSKIGRLHLPLQGRDDLLPRYTSATGGGQPAKEFSRNAIEAAYEELTSEARNQYTLGYSAHAAPGRLPYREIEVQVDLSDLKIYAKDRYYPAPSMRLAPQAAPTAATPAAATPAPASPAPVTPAATTPAQDSPAPAPK